MRCRSEPVTSSVKQKRKSECGTAADTIQSSHISSTLHDPPGRCNVLADPCLSLESKIRALQAGAQSLKPSPVVNFLVNSQKPVFSRWGATSPHPPSPYPRNPHFNARPAPAPTWQPFPNYRPHNPHNPLTQWWKQNVPTGGDF